MHLMLGSEVCYDSVCTLTKKPSSLHFLHFLTSTFPCYSAIASLHYSHHLRYSHPFNTICIIAPFALFAPSHHCTIAKLHYLRYSHHRTIAKLHYLHHSHHSHHCTTIAQVGLGKDKERELNDTIQSHFKVRIPFFWLHCSSIHSGTLASQLDMHHSPFMWPTSL